VRNSRAYGLASGFDYRDRAQRALRRQRIAFGRSTQIKPPGRRFSDITRQNRATGQRRFFRHTCALRQDHNIFLGWNGTIPGHEFESFEVLADNDQGLLEKRIVAYRPLLALQIFRDLMYPKLKDLQPPEYWSYAAGSAAKTSICRRVCVRIEPMETRLFDSVGQPSDLMNRSASAIPHFV
jgi:hypothetical protein